MANSLKTAVLVIAVLSILPGCNSRELDPDSYMKYYEKNHQSLVKSKELDELVFEADLIPHEVLAMRELNTGNSGRIDKLQYAAAYGNYKNAWYFGFRIKASEMGGSLKKIIHSKENNAKIRQYLASAIREDFSIEVDSKKINCGLINVEADLSIQDSFLFIMSFEKPASEAGSDKDITLVYKDNMFRNGILKFRFSGGQLNDFPKIKVI